MKRIYPVVLLFAVAVLCFSCRKRDIRTIKIHVPEMKNTACATLVNKKLSRVPGVKVETVRIDIARRTVTVSYDSIVLSMKNIEFAIAEAGFKANDIPADEKAARNLPPECTE